MLEDTRNPYFHLTKQMTALKMDLIDLRAAFHLKHEGFHSLTDVSIYLIISSVLVRVHALFGSRQVTALLH